jgi:hypothetical protein
MHADIAATGQVGLQPLSSFSKAACQGEAGQQSSDLPKKEWKCQEIVMFFCQDPELFRSVG